MYPNVPIDIDVCDLICNKMYYHILRHTRAQEQMTNTDMFMNLLFYKTTGLILDL